MSFLKIHFSHILAKVVFTIYKKTVFYIVFKKKKKYVGYVFLGVWRENNGLDSRKYKLFYFDKIYIYM